jgi:hypothetical protein
VNKKLILNNLLLVCFSETQNSLKVSIPHKKEIKLYWYFVKYKVKKLKLGSKGTQAFRGERFQVKVDFGLKLTRAHVGSCLGFGP